MTEKKMYEFAHIHQPALFTDQDLAEGLGRNMDKLEIIFLSAQSKARSIAGSKDLTRPGKVNKQKELSEKVDRETKDWRASIYYAEMIRQVEKEMKPIQTRPDDVVGELRKSEIRNHLRSLDPVLQESTYREAAADGSVHAHSRARIDASADGSQPGSGALRPASTGRHDSRCSTRQRP